MATSQVYIETSVWGMIPAGQNPALRQPTLDFLLQCERRDWIPCISDIVVDEIFQAPSEAKEVILRRVSEVNPVLLPVPQEVEKLAQRFINEGIVPLRRLDDAIHVACALIHELEMLVSWNYRHIVNVQKAEKFNAVAVLCGIRGRLQIHTPFEVVQWK